MELDSAINENFKVKSYLLGERRSLYTGWFRDVARLIRPSVLLEPGSRSVATSRDPSLILRGEYDDVRDQGGTGHHN